MGKAFGLLEQKSCLKSKLISSTYVSSDDKKILSEAKKFGSNIILRQKNMPLIPLALKFHGYMQ